LPAGQVAPLGSGCELTLRILQGLEAVLAGEAKAAP
jgi:hypothetical protein